MSLYWHGFWLNVNFLVEHQIGHFFPYGRTTLIQKMLISEFESLDHQLESLPFIEIDIAVKVRAYCLQILFDQ